MSTDSNATLPSQALAAIVKEKNQTPVHAIRIDLANEAVLALVEDLIRETENRSAKETKPTEVSLCANLVLVASDGESQKAVAKRLHDLSSAVRSLQFLVESLKDGYRFDDDLAAEKIRYIARAVSIFASEEKWVRKLLEP